jgi:CRP-like cAMP-binding protein
VAPLSEEASFLRRAPLFAGLPDEKLAVIYLNGETLNCGPGHVIFEEGTHGVDVFVVKSGVLEVRKDRDGPPRVVTYLSIGECVGEMSLITGAKRSATVRVPERATVLRLPGPVFSALLMQHAEIALGLARVLARRLELANQLHQAEQPGKHLAGDLAFFDVPEVCQTLMQSRRTGVMRIRSPKVQGEVALWLDDGRIRHARFGSIKSTEAALVLLRSKLEGSFEFRGSAVYGGPAEDPELPDGSIGLLLEAAQQGDEIEALRKKLGSDGRAFGIAGQFPWNGPLEPKKPKEDFEATSGKWRPLDEDQRGFAKEIWQDVSAGKMLKEILGKRIGREHLALQVLHALLKSGSLR